ncbi:T9SS type A sorting domain-containing protein [Flavivirga eckloniae]|uniref:Secretion system C-terminal sorting domain-containing protein n=1 Tax=Flavivirga eckloniae TaxID=1803846 RepID=A0A2K9PNR9_9FLAO|nr:T9SS type A sorting domain-containing protein [Flavivirga eckloniae]AUP78720.1 hypothetical protein C1H87_08370 [Flavivirga eckloniae]
MKKTTFLLVVLTIVFNTVNAQTVFDFDTNATDNGDNITETIDGITMTLSGASDLRLVNGGGAFGTSGDAAMTTIAPTSLTITFSEAVNVNSILPFSASAQSLTYTLTPDGGGSPDMVVLTSGSSPGESPVDLNWTNVTTITVTSSTGSANFGFDDISVSAISSPPATVFDFDTNATDNGDNITETIDGITMTLSGASDLRLVNGGGAFGTSGDAAMTTIAPTSLTITFSEAVNVNSILPFSASAQSLTYTLTPDGGGSPEMVVLTSGSAPGESPVDLNWTNVTTITVTSSTGSANFGFDDISVNPITLSVQNDTLSKIIVSPNPVRNVIYIKNILNLKFTNVYNSLGQRVLQSKDESIDVGHLSKGVYFLQVHADEGVQVKRIIKK